MKSLFSALLVFLMVGTGQLFSEIKGKVDVGPAFVHVDILESGKTIKRMDVWAARGDGAYYVFPGLAIKPTLLYGNGGAAKGGIFSGSLGASFTIPYKEQWLIAPGIGVNYSHVWTKIDIPGFFLKNLNENFKSWAPLVSLDVYYNFAPKARLCVSVQYAWARTHTRIHGLPGHLGRSKSKSEGFTYSGLIEHDLNKDWSVNIGAAYNLSLTKEKHGIRGTGVKAGLVRWF